MPNAFPFSLSPFDCLDPDERRQVRGSVDIAYFPQQAVILEPGATPSHLFVIVKGYVQQMDEGEVVATLGPDDCFDGRSLVAGRVSSRFVAGALLRHVWQGGHDALDAERLRVLAEQLSEQVRPGQDMHSDGPKALLRANTEAAQAAGVFGVPAFEVDGKLFWGLDGLPMLRAYLAGDAWFDGPQWDAVAQVPSGLAPAAKG